MLLDQKSSTSLYGLDSSVHSPTERTLSCPVPQQHLELQPAILSNPFTPSIRQSIHSNPTIYPSIPHSPFPAPPPSHHPFIITPYALCPVNQFYLLPPLPAPPSLPILL